MRMLEALPFGNGKSGPQYASMKTKQSATPRSNRAKFIGPMKIGAMAAALVGASFICGCAANREHGDFKSATDDAALSPEQCANGAAIRSAAQSGADEHSYIIQPGDELAVDFYLNPEFNDQVVVGPDGKIILRLIGAVQAAGATPPQLAQEIDQKYLAELRSPDAAVHV